MVWKNIFRAVGKNNFAIPVDFFLEEKSTKKFDFSVPRWNFEANQGVYPVGMSFKSSTSKFPCPTSDSFKLFRQRKTQVNMNKSIS